MNEFLLPHLLWLPIVPLREGMTSHEVERRAGQMEKVRLMFAHKTVEAGAGGG